MVKKIIAAVCAVAALFCLSACNINRDNSKAEITTVLQTERVTRIHNNFKDVLPSFKFENPISEKYEESIRYVLSVRCSQKEFEKYVKALKKAGFVNSATEASTYYSAKTEDGYFAEVTYIQEILTVHVKKV